MMLRVVLFEIYKHYRLRLAPGATVIKNTVVTTKPAAVPITRLPREPDGRRRAAAASRDRPRCSAPVPRRREWGEPTEIPETSAYRHLVIAYGSNFGANKELAERFAERSDFHGYTSDVITLNELAESPPRTQPWLLVVMTSTYTSNPPSNATAFKSWLERTEPVARRGGTAATSSGGSATASGTRSSRSPATCTRSYPSSAPRRSPSSAYGDVGSPTWERLYTDWNTRVWPVLLELSGARPTSAAAARVAAEKAATGALTSTDSNTAMQRSLYGDDVATQPIARSRAPSMMRHSPGSLQPASMDARRQDRPIKAAASRGCCSCRRSSPTPSGWTRSRHASWCAGSSRRPSRRSGRGIWRSACRPASPTGLATTSASARRTTRSGSSGSPGTSAPRSTACSWRRRR